MSARRFVSLWAPVAAYMTLIFILSEQEGSLSGLEFVWDKLLHLVGYGILGVLVLRAFHGGLERLRWKPSLTALVFTAAYGALDEYHQSFVSGREASVWDVVANGVGVCLAFGSLALLLLFKASRGRG